MNNGTAYYFGMSDGMIYILDRRTCLDVFNL
jgi:hypothetical protein